MPKRFSNHHRDPELVAWSDLPPVVWKAFGIALLIGFVTGVGYIAWKLFEVNVLR